MSIQRRKAQELGLEFNSTFTNFHLNQGSPFMIRTDMKRFKQVLLTLQANAIKFTKEGRVQIQVKLEQDKDKDKQLVVVRVIDTGIGIKEAD
mmetsp:Transcript_24889/g.38700  ORF Transcript_24889/g.38700 Transcript_24889/m.38700 type:complete len:92 (+) Transcript_24889:157-432(+)